MWAAFIIVWLISALTTKRAARRAWWRLWWLRLGALAVIFIVLRYESARGHGNFISGMVFNAPLNILGLLLAAAGVGLAVWARFYLGSNWGMPMSLRQGHELVTTGPYALLRHPIYTGILLAAIGSSLINLWWLVLFFTSAIYFTYSTRVEDKDMAEHFPETYGAYHARTYRLIPFVW